MTLSQSSVGRSVGLISKRRGEGDPNGPGSLAAEDTCSMLVKSRTTDAFHLSPFHFRPLRKCGKMVMLPISR